VKNREDQKILSTKRIANQMKNLASFKEERENDDDDDSDGDSKFDKNVSECLPVPEDDCRSIRGLRDDCHSGVCTLNLLLVGSRW